MWNTDVNWLLSVVRGQLKPEVTFLIWLQTKKISGFIFIRSINF